MKNSYRVKENIVHISMVAGMLLKNACIDVDSTTLTDFILDLADEFEEKVAPTLEDGTYLESIDLFAHKELLKAFTNTNFLEIGNMHHTNTQTATFHFYVNEEEVEVQVNDAGLVVNLEDGIMKLIAMLLKQNHYVLSNAGIKFEDSVVTLTANKD